MQHCPQVSSIVSDLSRCYHSAWQPFLPQSVLYIGQWVVLHFLLLGTFPSRYFPRYCCLCWLICREVLPYQSTYLLCKFFHSVSYYNSPVKNHQLLGFLINEWVKCDDHWNYTGNSVFCMFLFWQINNKHYVVCDNNVASNLICVHIVISLECYDSRFYRQILFYGSINNW